MSNDNGWNPTDHLIKINDVIIDMDKNEVWGCYRDEKEVLRKDMTDEELIHAHQVIRQRGFDLMAFKTKDC